MFKKYISLALILIIAVTLTSACAKKPGTDIKVAMIVGPGTIDDKAYNQGVWEGLLLAEKDLGCQIEYRTPSENSKAAYLAEISDLTDEGYSVIVAPGRDFAGAITTAQDKHPNSTFIAIDFAPDPVCENSAGVFYAEHQAGFMAGFAAAIELQDGSFGGIYGISILPVQLYDLGFRQGVKYANAQFGTTITLDEQNFVFTGKLDEPAIGQSLAARMYDNGVKCIFTSAELTSTGVVAEAKSRRAAGAELWLVGTDVDHFAEGVYDELGNSVFLTSAIKNFKASTFNIIKSVVAKRFPGGKELIYDARFDGVGLPAENPNLSRGTQKFANKIFAQVKSGKIDVLSTDAQPTI